MFVDADREEAVEAPTFAVESRIATADGAIDLGV